MIGTMTEQQREAKGKTLALGLVVMALMAAYLLLTATPAYAKTFTVNFPGDDADKTPGDGSCFTGSFILNVGPECTLRAAIEEANALRGADTIAFDILGGGVQTMS